MTHERGGDACRLVWGVNVLLGFLEWNADIFSNQVSLKGYTRRKKNAAILC